MGALLTLEQARWQYLRMRSGALHDLLDEHARGALRTFGGFAECTVLMVTSALAAAGFFAAAAAAASATPNCAAVSCEL